MEINVLTLNIIININLRKSDTEKIRGYLGNLFWDNPYAHQHKPDGSFIYQYPCVQYKVIDGSCLLIGFNEGSGIIMKTFHDLKSLNIDGKWEEILSKGLESYTTSFSILSEHTSYSFLTPWLALNEENHKKYRGMKNWEDKKELLNKILVGNVISMSKSLGYTVPSPIIADIKNIKEIHTSLKGTPMLGFLGTFSVNFEIPDYWGIGKSVSRGFGTVKKNLTQNNV
ncbi:MAG: CRISPR-associated endonuclease Cas6 [bacterium]